MKDSEIKALEKILVIFETHALQQERLLKEFRLIIDQVRDFKKGRGYQKKPEYYKKQVRLWEKENPGKLKEYQRRYQEKKKAERLANILDLFNQEKTVAEISILLNISEKTILNCLKQNEEKINKGVLTT